MLNLLYHIKKILFYSSICIYWCDHILPYILFKWWITLNFGLLKQLWNLIESPHTHDILIFSHCGIYILIFSSNQKQNLINILLKSWSSCYRCPVFIIGGFTCQILSFSLFGIFSHLSVGEKEVQLELAIWLAILCVCECVCSQRSREREMKKCHLVDI